MFKSGYVSIVGQPNVGKSSLVNALVKESVSIVTAKPQTTRKNTLGILNLDKAQIVFVDTPGIIDGEKGLNSVLRMQFDKSFDGVDLVIGAVGPWECMTDTKPWIVEFLSGQKCKTLFALTQVDRYNPTALKESLVPRFERWGIKAEQIYFTSSKAGDGLKELTTGIEAQMEEGPEFYPRDEFTTQSLREISSEIVRKHCFELTHQEVPYGLAVLVTRFEEGPTHKIFADIIISKESHKPIVIGKGGSVIREIGIRSRLEIEKTLGQKVALMTQVVVKPKWMESKSWLTELGLHE